MAGTQCAGCGKVVGDGDGALDVHGTIVPVCSTCLLKFCGEMLTHYGVNDPAEVARLLRVAASSPAPIRTGRVP